MLTTLHRWLPLVLIATAALWLRTTELARRPMHADEANQAVKLGQLLDTGRYTFDPADHHGPTLYYLAAPIAWLRHETSLAALTETTVRLLPAVAGTFAVLLLAALASPPIDEGAVPSPRIPRLLPLAAALFLTVSPPAVYYSRYFIQETLLVTFTLTTFLFAQRWWHTPQLRWALLAGVSAGLMQATKAVAPLFLVAGTLAALPLVLRAPRSSPHRATLFRHLPVAFAATLFTSVLFYTSFFTHFAGLRDALATYTHATSRAVADSGHEKPFAYYIQLLAWHRAGGLTFHQLPFLALAAVGTLFAFRRSPLSPLLRWSALYTLLVALALSLTPYKTPWHVLHLVPGLALLAAGAVAALRPWWLPAALGAFALTLQIKQTQLTAFLRPADSRNPYAYVHSSPDVLKLRALADSALATSPEAIVRVIATEYWPIPWYFRGLERVGYWATPPANSDAALVIASADLADAVRAQLTGDYRESLLGLRPGVLCVVFTREP